MILSRKHKFIFLHNPKAAGSSVTVSLARYLGPWDIQVGCHNEAMEEGIRPNFYSYVRVLHPRVRCGLTFARKFLADRKNNKVSAQKAYQNAFSETIAASWGKVFGYPPEHPNAKDVRNQFEREWREYLNFCVVRNPWDRVVSAYHFVFRKKRENVPSFSQWVEEAFPKFTGGLYSLLDPCSIYRIDGKLAVDCVIKYENLSNDLQAVCNRIGLNWDGWLPTKKGTYRKKKDYREFYDDKTRRCIEEVYKQDIDEFGYDF